MIRSKEMVRATLFAHANDREKVLEGLHRIGLMQFKDIRPEDIDSSMDIASSQELKEISDYLLRVSRIISILKLFPIKMGFKQSLLGLETMRKSKNRRKSKAELLKEAKAFLGIHEDGIIKIEDSYDAVNEKIANIRDIRKIIDILERNDIPAGMPHETKNLVFVSGLVANTKLESLRASLGQELDGNFHMESREDTRKDSLIVIAALKESSVKLNFFLKKYGVNVFPAINIPKGNDPVEWAQEKEDSYLEKKEDLLRSIQKSQKILDECIFLREELELLRERYEAVHKLRESKKFFMLQGWVLKSKVDMLQKSLKDVMVHVEVPKEDDNVPVELSNPGFIRPFENLVELYALPKYKELDPTFIVGPLFLIYAGFMLTDFVYGLGFLVLGIGIFALFRKQSVSMRDISISIMGIGIFSMIFGVLTGSYLGDASKYIIGMESSEIALWKDPLADPMYFLIISLVVGVIHLNIGLLLGLAENIRKKEWKAVFFERFVWWFLQGGLALIAMKSMMGMPLQSWIYYFGWVLFIGAVIMLVIANGPLGLLNITGFMGDAISYSRLFALALSTAGIAMTVNLLAAMVGDVPYIGFVLAAILALCGHLFSFAMNGLGSFVHSIRLQFVEFFGKFYEGGGDKFTPFKEERIYTEVEE